MKTIVIYQSSTGFTAKYAKWIAEELNCQAIPLKQIKTNELTAYDIVIYGGYIMANMVAGYDKIKKLNLKNVIVFGDGMSVPSEELTKNLAEQNGIPKERFFYFEGGYKPQELGFLKKMMMNMIKKSLEKKAEKTAEDIHMLETFQGADNTNRDAIKPLIEFIKN